MNDFPQATLDMWQARVAAILKGESAEKLVSRTADGIRIEPLYQQVQGARAERAEHAPWIVMQRVDHPDGVKANAQALDDLENGAGGLCIVNGDADIGRVLQGVALHAIHTRLEGGDGLAKAFADYVKTQPIDPARLSVSFGASDAGELAAQGFKGPFLRPMAACFMNKGRAKRRNWPAYWRGLSAPCGNLKTCRQRPWWGQRLPPIRTCS